MRRVETDVDVPTLIAAWLWMGELKREQWKYAG